MIEPMKAKQSLKAAELQDGDIVCFQKADVRSSESDRESVEYLTNQLTLADNDRSVSSKSSEKSSLSTSKASERTLNNFTISSSTNEMSNSTLT